MKPITTFKNEGPDHIGIELERMPLELGEQLEFIVNGKHLAHVQVSRKRKAEFDHWSDEGVDFPVIQARDILLIRYDNTDVLKGIFSA